ncbi:MAG TPA: GIY-YIG nuclease family protein [Verrucomicrobiae bacterium]|nr:GIY-YIG nuclease family protein [Verrucomicrobiae bacterium]
MLRCSDDSLYVGITSDFPARVEKHNQGFGPEYTRKHRPVTLIWYHEFANSAAARKREIDLKGWSRKKKLELVAGLERGGGNTRGGLPGVNPSRELIAPAQGKGE